MAVPICPGEGPLGAGAAEDLELGRGELPAPFLLGLVDYRRSWSRLSS
jgi:hypothetical protein